MLQLYIYIYIYNAAKARDNKKIRENERSHGDLSDHVSCKSPRYTLIRLLDGCFYPSLEVCIISFALRGTLDPLHLIINNFLWANNYMHLGIVSCCLIFIYVYTFA